MRPSPIPFTPFRFGPVLLTLLLAAALPASGQERSTPVFGEAIEVNLVQVEVVVTGKGGERVSGLERSDFRLLVDGEPVEVEYFEEIEGLRPARTGRRADGAAEEAPGPGSGATAEVGRRLLVFVDDSFTDRSRRRRLLDALAGNLDTLGPSDQMAVVRYAGGGLEVLTDWTGDRERLRRVLLEARDMEAGDLVRQGLYQTRNFDVVFREVAEQMQQVTRAAALAMRSFADAPGRRLLVPVTGGWNYDLGRRRPTGKAPRTLAQEARSQTFENHAVEDADYAQNVARVAEAANISGEKLLRPITDAANRLGYTIYPMHVGGQTPNLSRGSANPMAGFTDETRRASLLFLAEETGGRIATEGAANPRPLEPVLVDTGSYYVLGFTRDRVEPGERLEIGVKLPGRKKLDLRHRRSVFELTAEQRAEMEAEQALVEEPAEETPVETAEVEPPRPDNPQAPLELTLGKLPAGGGPVEVPLSIQVPVDGIATLPVGGGFHAVRLTLRVATVDERGRRSEITATPVELTGKDPEPGTYITLDLAVRLRPVAQKLAVTIHDKVGGGSLEKTVTVEPRD